MGDTTRSPPPTAPVAGKTMSREASRRPEQGGGGDERGVSCFTRLPAERAGVRSGDVRRATDGSRGGVMSYPLAEAGMIVSEKLPPG